MWRCWILIACAAGVSSILMEPRNINISASLEHRGRNGRQHEIIKRFACPIGFFRLKRYCYYLSAGTAPWRDAYFHCRDRNATLAILDRNGKDRMLRKYLMGDQFTKLERWIGGIFNWQQMAWEWGVTGEKMVFQSFGKMQPGKSEQYAWHCIIMDPALKYKWNARSCVERKHYICEVPAGRIGRRRKKTADPLAPQNQRLKPRKKGNKYPGEGQKPNKRNKQRPGWRRNWIEQNANHQWANGVKLGSRPPSNNRVSYPRNRMRHHSNRTVLNYSSPKVAQILPQGQEYGAFLGDGPSSVHRYPQGLTDMNKIVPDFHAKINNFGREEVLLKP